MDAERPWLEIGRIEKAHGLRGEVVVRLTTNVEDRLTPGTVVRAGTDELTVQSCKPHQHRFVVAFGGIDDRTAAEGLHGRTLTAEALPAEAEPDALWIHELLGAEVVDTTGAPCGTVTDVLENPASDLLVLDGGPLVPLTFVTGWDDEGRVVIDPPPGLFELE